MNKILRRVVCVLALVVGFCGMMNSGVAYADHPYNQICDEDLDDLQKEAAGCNTTKQVTDVALTVIQSVIAIAGLIAVIVIVFAGQRYVVANGDPGKLKQAKDMLVWAVVGLIVAVLSFAIVTFVSRAIG